MGRLDDEHIGGKLLLLAGDALITMLLTLGGALSWLSVYVLPNHSQLDLGAVIVCCAAASAVSAALLSRRRGLWEALALLAAGGWACWRIWEKVAEDWPLSRPPRLPELIERHPAMLYLLCAMLALVMGLIAVRTRQWYLAAALSMGLVLPAIAGGTLPMWGAMLASFAAWGAMLLTALFSRRDPEGLGRAQLLSLAGMWALILLLVTALPMEGYTRPQWATDARVSLIRGVTRQMERFFDMDALSAGILADLGLDLSIPGEASAGSSGTAGDAGIGDANITGAFGGGSSWRKEDLRSLGPRRYRNRQVMTVKTDDPDAPGKTLYLLGGTLNTYTGETWEQGSFFFGRQPVALFPASTAPEGPSYTMSVRYTNLYGTWYYPYRLLEGGDPDEDGRLSDVPWRDLREAAAEDETVFPDRGRVYEITYRPGGPEDGYEGIPVGWVEAEQSYRQDVTFEYAYLDVPDAAREALEVYLTREKRQTAADSLEAMLETAGEEERSELEEALQRLRREASSAPTLEDFGGPAELTEDMSPPERFRAAITAASRTAALLETLAVYDLGAPAMERGEDFVSHFLKEGRGYCVHFATAGALLLRLQGIPARYAAGYTARLNSTGESRVMDSDAHAWVEIYLDGYGWYPVEMTPGYSGGGGDVTLSDEPETPDPEEPDEPDRPEEDPERPEEDPALPGEEPGEESERSFVFPWRAVLGIVLTLGALCVGYALSFLPRRLEKGGADTNRSVICAYLRYRRAVRLGAGEEELLEELGRKAKFSQHTLTEEERSAAWARLEAVSGELLARRTGGRRVLILLLRPLL